MSKRARSLTPTSDELRAHHLISSISSKRAKTTGHAPSPNSQSQGSTSATTSNTPDRQTTPPVPELDVHLDITLHVAVEAPGGIHDYWTCKLDGCPMCFDTADEWMRHVRKDHKGLWRFERKPVDMITGYAPPPEEMFGGRVANWRPARDERFLVRTREHTPPPRSPFPILGNGSERSRSGSPTPPAARHRQDTWVREMDGDPFPPNRAWSGEDSWIRARDGPPPTPEWRRVWSPSQSTDYGEDEEDEEVLDGEAEDGTEGEGKGKGKGEDVDGDRAYSPEVGDPYPCDCSACGGAKEPTPAADSGPATTQAKPTPTRYELYGPFKFTQLPGELRNAVYSVTIEDAVQDLPEADRQHWRTQPLFQSSRTLRSEALAIYASSVHFSITFPRLDPWMKLLSPSFLRHLRKIDIAFAPYEEISRIFDFTNMYRLACLLGPKSRITLTGTDVSLRKNSVGAQHWSMTENHVNALQALLDGAKKQELRAFFEEPSTLSEMYVNAKGQLISAKATSAAWVTYEDLKEMFQAPSDFRLTVGSMPWQGTPLASTMAPRTTRASKKGAVGVEVKKEGVTGGFGGLGGTGSFGGTGTLASSWRSKSVAGWTFMQERVTGAVQVTSTASASAWAPGVGLNFELKKDADDSGDERD